MKLLRDQSQALLFLIGCLGIIFGYIRVITDDIRRGAGPILMSRPIGSFCLIAGKWAGIASSIILLHVSGLVSYLLVSEISYDSDFLNTSCLVLYFATIGAGLMLSGIRHYVLRGSYVFYANLILVSLLCLLLLVRVSSSGSDFFDWRGIESGIMIAGGILAFSAVLLPVAVIADSAVVLTIGIIVFLFGLISEYLISTSLGPGIVTNVIKSILPNWQYYWVADRLVDNQHVPLGYFGICGIQSFAFVIMFIIIATVLYDRLEIGKN